MIYFQRIYFISKNLLTLIIILITNKQAISAGVQPQQDPGEPSGRTALANERESETKLGAESEVYLCTAPLYP